MSKIGSRVKFSTYCIIATIVVFGLIVWGIYATYSYPDKCMLVVVASLLVLIFSMLYCPLSISADEREVIVHSPFRNHRIPMRRITYVERFQPTLGRIRVCGSGGFMGYWGLFKEGDTGRYEAYCGNSSDCFMIRLDNGDKYVLGCKNPDVMVDYIKSNLATANRLS